MCVSGEGLQPAEMTDDWLCRASRTDMSLFVKAGAAGLRKSKDLANKCSEALKIDFPSHRNSFIFLAADLFNYIST